MKPQMGGALDAEREQHIIGILGRSAFQAVSWRRANWIAVQPFGDAACEGPRLGYGTWQATTGLGNRDPLIEESPPILGQRAVLTGPQLRHDVGLVAGQQNEDGGWGG